MSITYHENELDMLIRAMRFASLKHCSQRRKGSSAPPYINHPIEVCENLWRTGGVRDTVTLTAALLHDTVEDTGTKPDEIREAFGEEVLSLVMEVTDDKSLPKAERKRLQVEHAPHKSSQAKLIKLADKISNVNEITLDPPDDWPWQRRKEYLDWAEQVVNGLRGENPALEKQFDEVLAEGRKRLQENKIN